MTGHPTRPNNSVRLNAHAPEALTNDVPVAQTPHRLLWTTAIIATALCVVAFVLWVTNGPVLLFDMIVALCT